MKVTFDNNKTGDAIEGPSFSVSRESIRLFCDASLDYNPLHLDDEYMKGSFGKTTFGGIIMHVIDVVVNNQNGEQVATGEAMVEFPTLAKAS